MGKGRLGERAGKNVVWKRGSVISGFFMTKVIRDTRKKNPRAEKRGNKLDANNTTS